LGELDAAQVASEAERLGTVADQLIAGRTVYAPTGGCWTTWDANGALFTSLAATECRRPTGAPSTPSVPHPLPQGLAGSCTCTNAVTWQVLSSILATAHR